MTKLPPLFESKAGIRDTDSDVVSTGAMIALRPRQDHIDRLAVEGGEEPAELHTTILFMGKGDDYTYDTRARIIDAMRRVALEHRQVTAKGWNIGIFNPDGDQPCIALGVGGTEMVTIRNAIISALQGMDLLQVPEQHEPWVPHVTLNYTDDPKLALDYVDLVGDVVFDAIRVVFSGIVDDIPLQTITTADEGYAGGNRYAFAPPTLMKSFSFDIRHPVLDRLNDKQDSGKCLYCKAKATKKTGIDGGAYIMSCEGHEGRAKRAAEGESLEEKVRHVRTAAGARRFGQPIGSVIVADGSALKNLKEEESEYDGYTKYNARGKAYYVHKNGEQFEALDASDNVVATNSSEEGLLKDLDGGKGADRVASRRHVEEMFVKNKKYLNRAESEYEGYAKYVGVNGMIFYHERGTGKFYDANDNLLIDDHDLIAAFSKLNMMSKGPAPTPRSDPGGLKKVESDYDGYDKFIGQNGKPVYRWHGDGEFYDENDEPVDVNDYNGEKVKANLTKQPATAAPKKPLIVDMSLGRQNSAVSAATRRRVAKMQEAQAQVSSPRSAAAPTRVAGSPDEVRANLPGKVDNADELDAALNKVKGSTTPADVITEIRRLALRQGDVRNRRVLMLYANSLREAKMFAGLMEMDPLLRAAALEVKLITPGGRVGSSRSLGSRSNGENWIERTPMGKLPNYIRIVANGLLKAGHSKSKAIAMAVAAMKRWAAGGDNVRPQVQAAAAKAVAEWTALKASA